jgi:hypothetical protein
MDWHTDESWLGDYVDSKERREGVPGDFKERREGVPGDFEERREGVPGDFEERREGVPGDSVAKADAARAAEAHLATCARCRGLMADFQAIRALSRSLDSHEPSPRVWARIALAVDTPSSADAAAKAEPETWRAFSLSTFGLSQAAALATAVVIGTGLWWIGTRLEPAARSVDVGAPVMTGVGSVPMQLAEAQFTTAIAGLERMTTEQQDALDPDTMGVMQANLSVIDAAITESRAVLEVEPESDVAQQSLFEALRSKVALLQDILALINEMRKGDPEAAARIVSGLNQ